MATQTKSGKNNPKSNSGNQGDRKRAQSRGAPKAGKLATITVMLRRPKGATIDELCKFTGWQAHSVRGAISGAIKKKMGLSVTSSMSDDVRRYRVIN